MNPASPVTVPSTAVPQLNLKNNRRASLTGLLLPAMVILLGSLLWWSSPQLAPPGQGASPWMMGLSAMVMATGVVMGVAIVHWSLLPRLSYEGAHLLVQLRLGSADRIPIEFVECFFIGQGPGEGYFGQRSRPEVVNLVVRLAESAREWHHGEVRPALGSWCDGYITLRGMWCEPLDGDRVEQLNRALVHVKRSRGLRA